MYAETWGPSFATNNGQYRGNDHYMIQYSFGYSNSTNAGSPNPLAAVYQARNDILWPGNTAQPYCSSILGYTTPLATSVATSTASTTAATLTATASTVTTITSFRFGNAKRSAAAAASVSSDAAGYLIKVGSNSQTIAARAAASTVPEPNVLTKYPSNIVSSACALAITQNSVTSTIQSTTTTTATLTATATVTAISTVTVNGGSPGIACGRQIDLPYQGTDFYYTVLCGVAYSSGAESTDATLTGSTYADCSANCGGDNYCFAFGFDFSTATCQTYQFLRSSDSVTGVSNANAVLAYIADTIAYTGPASS